MILKNKHTILILCLFAIGATANGQGQQWTLKQCLDYAHSNNIQIRQADLRIQESELNKKQSVASLFPSVTASTSIGLNRQNVRNSMNEYMSDNTVRLKIKIDDDFKSCEANADDLRNAIKRVSKEAGLAARLGGAARKEFEEKF